MSDVTEQIRGAVHAAVGHDSAVAHVTGAARYLDDVPIVSGTLEAALVLSPHAHARIRRIDLSAALAAPGVLAAITAADIPGKNDIAPIRSDEPALAVDVMSNLYQPSASVICPCWAASSKQPAGRGEALRASSRVNVAPTTGVRAIEL